MWPTLPSGSGVSASSAMRSSQCGIGWPTLMSATASRLPGGHHARPARGRRQVMTIEQQRAPRPPGSGS
jgi:hypothetical protein